MKKTYLSFIKDLLLTGIEHLANKTGEGIGKFPKKMRTLTGSKDFWYDDVKKNRWTGEPWARKENRTAGSSATAAVNQAGRAKKRMGPVRPLSKSGWIRSITGKMRAGPAG
jgi:hypothetical protein